MQQHSRHSALLDVLLYARRPPLIAFVARWELIAAVLRDLGDGVAAVLVEVRVQRRVTTVVGLFGGERGPLRRQGQGRPEERSHAQHVALWSRSSLVRRRA